jgi:hypothetical protein
LLHVFDLPFSLEIRESNGDSAYAYYTALWVIADDVEEAQRELQRLADSMSNFTTRPTRAKAAGEVHVPTRGVKTLMTHALEIWNSCSELRDASTKAKAIRVATTLAKNSPL